MEIVWDEPKRRANIAKHGLDFAEVDVAFFLGAIVREAREGRYRAFGMLGGVAAVLIFPPLGREAVSLISLRRAGSQDRRPT